MTAHVDRQRWQDFIDRRSAPEEWEAIRAHLSEPCEICEAALAELDAPDRLDGFVDDALHGSGAAGFDEVGYQRVMRAMHGPRRRRQVIAGASAFFAIAAAVILYLVPAAPPWRDKGPPSIPRGIRLQALVLGRDDQLAPLGARAQVAASSRVVFRVHLDEPGCVGMWLQRNGTVEPLLEAPLCLDAGDHPIAPDGRVVGLSIEPGPDLAIVAAPLEAGAHPASLPSAGPRARVDLIVERGAP